MTEKELKPCPFCGSEDVRADIDKSRRWPEYENIVECGNCQGASGYYCSREKAIEAWNRRATRKESGEGEG